MASDAPITISSLTQLHPTTLAALLKNPSQSTRVTVIDVRDSDHIGGHIRSSVWIPTDQLEFRMPELVRLHGSKGPNHKVVFHCMLSQQRGPSSALKFARALQADRAKKEKTGDSDGSQGSADVSGPEVCVLEGGFGAWQARYGEDERLTEGYVKDLWE